MPLNAPDTFSTKSSLFDVSSGRGGASVEKESRYHSRAPTVDVNPLRSKDSIGEPLEPLTDQNDPEKINPLNLASKAAVMHFPKKTGEKDKCCGCIPIPQCCQGAQKKEEGTSGPTPGGYGSKSSKASAKRDQDFSTTKDNQQRSKLSSFTPRNRDPLELGDDVYVEIPRLGDSDRRDSIFVRLVNEPAKVGNREEDGGDEPTTRTNSGAEEKTMGAGLKFRKIRKKRKIKLRNLQESLTSPPPPSPPPDLQKVVSNGQDLHVYAIPKKPVKNAIESLGQRGAQHLGQRGAKHLRELDADNLKDSAPFCCPLFCCGGEAAPAIEQPAEEEEEKPVQTVRSEPAARSKEAAALVKPSKSRNWTREKAEEEEVEEEPEDEKEPSRESKPKQVKSGKSKPRREPTVSKHSKRSGHQKVASDRVQKLNRGGATRDQVLVSNVLTAPLQLKPPEHYGVHISPSNWKRQGSPPNWKVSKVPVSSGKYPVTRGGFAKKSPFAREPSMVFTPVPLVNYGKAEHNTKTVVKSLSTAVEKPKKEETTVHICSKCAKPRHGAGHSALRMKSGNVADDAGKPNSAECQCMKRTGSGTEEAGEDGLQNLSWKTRSVETMRYPPKKENLTKNTHLGIPRDSWIADRREKIPDLAPTNADDKKGIPHLGHFSISWKNIVEELERKESAPCGVKKKAPPHLGYFSLDWKNTWRVYEARKLLQQEERTRLSSLYREASSTRRRKLETRKEWVRRFTTWCRRWEKNRHQTSDASESSD
ncbi:unnamed protein product [Cyprideis torosa]|uniref:Uncharacterized protein n=1 Tax=Cyprideis torosa TaxID=163714 RepID=A0A7R8ZMJ3_9CRUS|nr:unnamed protein product [Cyprideis torosa]CAG0888960.1 unnamed protein product [Cyprideis torosa]